MINFPACRNIYNQSLTSWCDYDEMEPDTSFLNGYQSLIDVWTDFLAQKNVEIATKTKVNKIRCQSVKNFFFVRNLRIFVIS
jgi:hypothetical protein